MPVLTFLAVVGLALIALLFVADATLENVSPMVTSDRSGLPKPWHPDATNTLASPPAPLPDTISQAAQPKPADEIPPKIEPAARAARAEAPPRDRRVTQQMNYQQSHAVDRFSIGNQ